MSWDFTTIIVLDVLKGEWGIGTESENTFLSILKKWQNWKDKLKYHVSTELIWTNCLRPKEDTIRQFFRIVALFVKSNTRTELIR